MDKDRLKSRVKQLETYAKKPGYFDSSYKRQKKKKDSDAYEDARKRVD